MPRVEAFALLEGGPFRGVFCSDVTQKSMGTFGA
jgi:hypothetical protein